MEDTSFAVFSRFINQVSKVEDNVLHEFFDSFEKVQYGRKEFITRVGETEKYLYFVLQGYQRSYFLKEDKEFVMAFTYPSSFSGIPESYLSGQASLYFLETITPSNLLRIHKERHTELLLRHRSLETFQLKLTEAVLIGLTSRHHEWMALSMEERFVAFCNRSRHLINEIPHKYIASYLRMDPANFSRMLGNIKL